MSGLRKEQLGFRVFGTISLYTAFAVEEKAELGLGIALDEPENNVFRIYANAFTLSEKARTGVDVQSNSHVSKMRHFADESARDRHEPPSEARESRAFGLGLGLALILNALIKPVWILGIDLQVQNRLGHADYGLFFDLWSLSVLLQIVLDLGLTASTNREISAGQPGFSLGARFRAKLVLSLLYFSVCALVVAGLGYGREAWGLFGLIVLQQFFASMLLFFRAIASGHQRFKADAWLSIVDKAVLIALCALFIYGPAQSMLSIRWFAGLQALAAAVGCLIALGWTRQHWNRALSRSLHPLPKGEWVSGLKAGLPYALLVLLMSIYTRSDAVLLGRWLGEEAAGIYATGFRLLDAANQLGYLMAGVFLPYFARAMASGKSIRKDVGLSARLLLLFSALVGGVGAVWADPICHWVYSDVRPEMPGLLALLFASFPAFAFNHLCGSLLTADARLKLLIRLSAFWVVLNFSLNALLIPRYGVLGAAFSALATQYASLFAQSFWIRKLYALAPDLKSVVQSMAIAAAAIVGSYALLRSGLPSGWGFALSIGAVLALSLSLGTARTLRAFFMSSAASTSTNQNRPRG